MNFRQKKAVERRMTRQFLMGVAVISLSACQTLGKLGPDATVVDAKAEVPIPSTWVEPASDALPNSDWVGEFQSAKLTELVDTALLKNPTIGNAEALLALRLQNRDVLIRSLKALLRDYPDANMLVPENFPALPALSGVGSPGDVLQRRPDVIAAERRIAQSGLNVDIARKALYPSLNLSGGLSETVINRQGSTTGFDLGDLFDLQDVAKRLTAQLTAPLFQGGRLRGQIEGQEAALRGQVEAYVETVLRAYQEVENALDGEGRLLEREAALRISLEEAQKAEERLETRYIEGLATILQLLDAQSRRLSAEAQLVNVKAERLNNRVRLYVALGGGTYGAEASTQQLAQLAN